jgi:hypothetical protein
MPQVLITGTGKKIIWILIKSVYCRTSYLNTVPGLAAGDVNGDGSTIYISGGSALYPGSFWFSKPNGRFVADSLP